VAEKSAKGSVSQYGGGESPQRLAGGVPSADDVTKFHQNADTDTRQEAIHHTTGPGNSQASPGNHRHRGGDSLPLLDDFTITGDVSDGTVLPSIIACLVALGAKDSSTA
jgi:hypothetical protein